MNDFKRRLNNVKLKFKIALDNMIADDQFHYLLLVIGVAITVSWKYFPKYKVIVFTAGISIVLFWWAVAALVVHLKQKE